VLAVVARLSEEYLLGYAVCGLLAMAAAFLSPTLAQALGQLARRVTRRSKAAVVLGTVGFTRNAGRNAVAVAALGTALANVVNADSFVTSMKNTTVNWYERGARADIVVFAAKKVQLKIEHPLPPAIAEGIAKLPEVAFVNSFRSIRQSFAGKPFYLFSADLRGWRKYNELPVVEGNFDEAIPLIESGKAIAASALFVHAYKVGLGDQVELQTPQGRRSFRIALIYIDYNADFGILLTDRSVYKKLWGDTLADALEVHLHPGVSSQKVRERIAEQWGKRFGLLALSKREYQRELMRFIEGSFAFTRATELVAIIVAILGIINTLLVTVIDRRIEIGVLKAIGADPKQMAVMLITEAALIGLAATVLGVFMGVALSAYIISEVLPMQMGWRLTWEFPLVSVLVTFVIAQVVAIVAALWPARSAGKIDPIQALQYE
jgi:putative ABC transport system permease protein